MILTLLNYKNYHNRLMTEPFNTIQEYIDIGRATNVVQLPGITNFNLNDGISTSQVINRDFVEKTPDYCIVQDDSGEIISRWYVMDATYTRYGQYVITLYRDVLSDWYRNIRSSVAFVERAMVDIGDPALYNDEEMTVNQILTRKDLLKDKTGCPWIVGYIPKNYPEDTASIEFNYRPNTPTADAIVPDIEDWSFYNNLNVEYLAGIEGTAKQAYQINSFNAEIYGLQYKLGKSVISPEEYNAEGREWQRGPTYTEPFTEGANSQIANASRSNKISYTVLGNLRKDVIQQRYLVNAAAVNNYLLTKSNVPQIPALLNSQVGAIIAVEYDTEYKYYTIVKETKYREQSYTITQANGGGLWAELATIFNHTYENGSLSTSQIKINTREEIVVYSLRDVQVAGKTTISSNRIHLLDQPYDMFAVPYSDAIAYENSLGDVVKPSSSMAMSFAQSIAGALGDGAIYDIQVLPYCPVEGVYDSINNRLIYRIDNTTELLDLNDEPALPIYWCYKSQFSLQIPYSIQLPQTAMGQKVMMICEKYRMCSPNMASFFDFDPVKNDGLDYIEVDCYYKPYKPYIHLNPHFKGLYSGGGVGWEVRGLDLSGNFSLTQISNAWANYQLQNKNFEDIFQRQQQNLETMRGYQRIEEWANVGAGALTTGAQMGLATGNPWVGVGAGAISGLAGAVDVSMSGAKHAETMSYNQEMRNYQIGNIKALPNSLTQVDVLSANNPIFPYMEYYTCLFPEVNRITDVLRYHGMTANCISVLYKFMRPEITGMKYLQAQIMTFDADFHEDNHVAEVIASELAQGVRI